MTNEKRIGNYLIEVHQDESPESPRSWDNLGTMICFHRRYDLGDKHDYNHVEYDSWSEQRKDIEKTENHLRSIIDTQQTASFLSFKQYPKLLTVLLI